LFVSICCRFVSFRFVSFFVFHTSMHADESVLPKNWETRFLIKFWSSLAQEVFPRVHPHNNTNNIILCPFSLSLSLSLTHTHTHTFTLSWPLSSWPPDPIPRASSLHMNMNEEQQHLQDWSEEKKVIYVQQNKQTK